MPSNTSVETRFWDKVLVDPDGCWEWQACRVGGYGQFSVGGTMRYAHQIAYERLVGPIPTGLRIDHLCRNRGCVNPNHLEPVTHQVNVLRGESIVAIQARKTHCDRGHPLTQRNKRGHRWCKECANEWRRDWRRNRAK